jgi:glycosyltransferase involved in cell wall biosynthesis
MRPKPLVSIIVPVFNCETFLPDCLASLAAQTYSPIEIVAVNDGSTDNSACILDEFVARDARFRVLHTTNKGLQSAWMAGVHASSGEFIGFVDADDWVHAAMFEILVDAAIETSARVVNCSLVRANDRGVQVDGDPCSWNGTGWFRVDGREAARELLVGVARGRSRILPSRCLKLFNRQLLVSNLEFCDGSVVMGEDVNIAVPCLLDVEFLVCLEAELYFYRQNPSSLTNKYLAGFATSNAALLGSLRRATRAKRVDLGSAELEYFGWLTLRALVNECRGPGGLWERGRRVTKIYNQRDARLGLRRLRRTGIDRSSQLVRLSCRVGMPFLSPFVVLATDWARRWFRVVSEVRPIVFPWVAREGVPGPLHPSDGSPGSRRAVVHEDAERVGCEPFRRRAHLRSARKR